MTDPRIDLLVREPWEAMTEQLRGIVRGLDAAPPARNALRAVIDMHVAWDRRTQLLDGSGVDVVQGVGCRLCDWFPTLEWIVTPGWRGPWCNTVEALRVALIEESTSVHVIPADTADQSQAWLDGYDASRINRERFTVWQEAGSPPPGPNEINNPYR